MTLLVLFILALIWLAVLVPPYLQNRSSSRPADSITSFRNQLTVLGYRSTGVDPSRQPPAHAVSAYPAGYVRPRYQPRAGMRRSEIRRRRREVFFTLVVAAVLTLALALVLQGAVWILHLAVDVVLAGYVLLLAHQQQRQVERAAKVTQLPSRPQPEPAYALRRSAH